MLAFQMIIERVRLLAGNEPRDKALRHLSEAESYLTVTGQIPGRSSSSR